MTGGLTASSFTTSGNVTAYAVNASSVVSTPQLCLNGTCMTEITASGGAGLAATQTFTGANTFQGSVTVSSFTAATATIQSALVSTATIGTEAIFAAASAPAGVPGKGVLFYDTATNVFMVSENGASARPIVDPPGNWTCTIRSAVSACINIGASTVTGISVACSGNEKLFSWGWGTDDRLSTSNVCSSNSTPPIAPLSLVQNKITGQGVTLRIYHPGEVSKYTKFTVYANCCQ